MHRQTRTRTHTDTHTHTLVRGAPIRLDQAPHNAARHLKPFLSYQPFGGWFNQLYQLAVAVQFARLAQRTLVLPQVLTESVPLFERWHALSPSDDSAVPISSHDGDRGPHCFRIEPPPRVLRAQLQQRPELRTVGIQ